MADDSATGQEGPPGRGTPLGHAPQMPLFYANSAGVRGSAFDLAVEFAYVTPAGEGEEPEPIWLARIAMSWEHARALHQLIGQQLDTYESQAGPLPDIERLKGGVIRDDR